MLLKNLNIKPALTDRKSFILDDSFIKMGSFLFPIKLSKYVPIMSICFIKNPKNADMVKKIFSNLRLTIGAIVLLKLMPDIWEYF